MQTQCPHCQTRFRITETQLDMADGDVRCGVCKEVFNALEIDTLETEPHDNAVHPSPGVYVEDEYEDKDSVSADKEDSYDLFDEEHNKTLSHVVPDHIREAQEHSASWLATGLWSLGIVLLTITLFLEYIWFNREQIGRLPEIQDALIEICLQYDCSRLILRDSSKIELLSRNVYSHPEHKNALVVNLTIQNTGNFSQPWPLMQVVFSDVRGKPVAARRFVAEEYLGSEPELPIKPDDSVAISMEIQDPGKQAVTYEFNFYSAKAG